MKKAPRDLNKTLSRSERRKVPLRVTKEMLAECTVCFRASTNIAVIENGKQVVKDNAVEMQRFSPADDVPDWVIENYPIAQWIAQGRIYCSPLPRMKTYAPTPTEARQEEIVVEKKVETEELSLKTNMQPLIELKSDPSMRAIKAAFKEAGIKFSNGASKSELLEKVASLISENEAE